MRAQIQMQCMRCTFIFMKIREWEHSERRVQIFGENEYQCYQQRIFLVGLHAN